MGCPVHNDDSGNATDERHDAARTDTDDRGELDRREFMKSALVIGGASALWTATALYGLPETASADGRDPIGIAARRNGQHARDAFETDVSEGGVSAHPSHHVTLHLDYGYESIDEDVEALLDRVQAFVADPEGLVTDRGWSNRPDPNRSRSARYVRSTAGFRSGDRSRFARRVRSSHRNGTARI
ncbi:hypothetical protein BRC93_13085 [Halobacteriales archaeon QS_5_70_15]|nr:MAG: hypothetical protein BRC93_13085 [Halobacteriales archaeon QS_5_70_15]